MECPNCKAENPSGAATCLKCHASLVPVASGARLGGSDAPTMDGVSEGRPTPATGSRLTPVTAGVSEPQAGSLLVLKPGSVLGGRYEILGLLGVGGMGAVYKARDREVDRLVVLKVIRPELAGNAEILQRFKQELILARQITHKNVIRIYDLGEADGIKFISMEYIEGKDLRTALTERGKFPPEEAAQTIRQVSEALEAAHAEGVVHRDLKPQNIMVDKQGKVTVMDFGIARSMEQPGLTQTGAIIGTPEYMSPEQAKGEETDARSDLFSLGIIFYELLTGKAPYHATSAVAMLVKRTQERAVPPGKLDATIPKYLNDVVVKCLEIDRNQRYQTASEIGADLGAHHAPVSRRGPLTLRMPRFRTVEEFPTKWLGPGLGLLVLVIIGVVFRGRIFERPSQPKPAEPTISIAILPFRNASGDPQLDWLGTSLAEMLSTDVGQSSHLRMVSSDRLQGILHDLQIGPNSTVDSNTIRQLAESSSAETVVWGQYARFGDQIRIDATVQDLKRDHSAALKVEAPNEKAVPEAVDHLAQAIRENLAISPAVVKELQMQSFKPSSKSLEALRDYSLGVQSLRQGKDLDAKKQLQLSIQEDPEFALAYSRLAQADWDLGHQSDAEQHSRKALDLSQNLPAPEKYLIAANRARITKDYPKAIEAYENLAKASPHDTEIQSTLGSLYEETGEFQKARDHYNLVLEADPKSVEALWKMGGVEIMSGHSQASLDYLNRALSLSIELGNDEKKALILQALGVAYRQLNKPQDALGYYQQSLEIQKRLGQKWGMAASLSEIAQVYSLLGKPDAALSSLNETLKLEQEIGAKKEAGDTLIDLGNFYVDRGQYDQALKMYQQSLDFQREAGDQTYQSLCLNNIGNVHFAKGEYEDALTYFQQALDLREKLKVPSDIAESVHNLAETNVRLGQYGQAAKLYLRALDLYRGAGDKRGAAVDSLGLGALFIVQGRYGAAVNSTGDALKTFRELKEQSPTMADVLSGYGLALAEAGRADEAAKALDEALALARGLKTEPSVAETQLFQAQNAFYRGDFKLARSLYTQSLAAASRTKDRERALRSKIGMARIAVGEGRAREAITNFKGLIQEADAIGSKQLSVECSVDLGEALVLAKDYSHAREILDPALDKAEKLGLGTLQARAHYLLGSALRLSGSGQEAISHYREAQRLLEEIRQESGNAVLERADLKPVYAESKRWAQGT